MDKGPALQRHHAVLRGTGGPRLVFVHGFGCDRDIWRFVEPAFEVGPHPLRVARLFGLVVGDIGDLGAVVVFGIEGPLVVSAKYHVIHGSPPLPDAPIIAGTRGRQAIDHLIPWYRCSPRTRMLWH